MHPAVQAKLDALPASPGVYVFKDANGEPLFVGKAANLKSRVRSYFQASTADSRFFIERLAYELRDVETFVAESEKEAALLENSLIKEHRPRYNVKLRDDKEFLSLRLDPEVAWPRLEVVRRPRKDKARYVAPYHSASDARSM
jgi:excinuclease ABC subunit C